MTLLKICGMRYASDLDICRKADYLGFVVMTDSPNEISLDKAAELMSSCDRKKVAVTTETRPEMLRTLVRTLEPDVLQLHSSDHQAVLRNTGDLGLPVWGKMTVGVDDGPGTVDGIHALVLDSPGLRVGGNGLTHDWTLSRKVRDELDPFPVVLAGGIRPQNAADAIRAVRPFALDVSSGVRGKDGKDPIMVDELMKNMRGALE